jgi:asparagine synthase (glutamine-hydrolysing)
MCGIAGIIGRLDDLNHAALERMSDAMIHRGPDASGMWVSAPDSRGWGALLAFRRLSILDLSPAGDQPMVDPLTGHVVVFNGEIYNFGDLRRRLGAKGQLLRSTGDTAVMLRALGLHGPGAVSWLRGMFAFACWDPKERRLLLARDPRESNPSTWLGRRIRMRAGRWPSPQSFAPCWPPSCWALLASTRRPWPAACGTASWSALVPPSRVTHPLRRLPVDR